LFPGARTTGAAGITCLPGGLFRVEVETVAMSTEMSAEKTGMVRAWTIQAALMVLAIYFYVFMEWLFFVTKPSFMSVLSAFDAIRILLASPAPPLLCGIIVTALFGIPAVLVRNRLFGAFCSAAVRLVTSVVLAVALFLLVDNFTYTVFGFGVRTTEGIALALYVVLAAVLVFFSFRFLSRLQRVLLRAKRRRIPVIIAVIAVAASGIAAVSSSRSGGPGDAGGGTDEASHGNQPNIFLISSDALMAGHMSIYGYHRATTPFLDSMAGRALVCENCFPNAGTSGASIASVLTGKLPTQTKLIYPPEILKGRDAYQHLPGVLRNYGYRNIDISIRYHADPEDLNLRNSFHWANFREIADAGGSVGVVLFLGQEPSYFLRTMGDRVMDRFMHVIGRKSMEDPLGEVVRPLKKRYGRDAERIRNFFEQVRGASSPLFVHMHLLGTHGPVFEPNRGLFSRGRKQQEHWETDFYDDAILTFDDHLKRIVQGLEKMNLLRESVIVIFSDHGQNFTVNDRLPLIFIFPGGRHNGRIKANVQNLDIAATILDYMDIAQPAWMGGLSLISSEIEPRRLIFTTDPKHRIVPDRIKGQRVADRGKAVPPFYSLKAMGVHCCQRYYELELASGVLTVSNTAGHTAPCDESSLPDPLEAGRLIIEHLEENGYDTSAIKTPLTVRVTH